MHIWPKIPLSDFLSQLYTGKKIILFDICKMLTFRRPKAAVSSMFYKIGALTNFAKLTGKLVKYFGTVILKNICKQLLL